MVRASAAVEVAWLPLGREVKAGWRIISITNSKIGAFAAEAASASMAQLATAWRGKRFEESYRILPQEAVS